MSAEGAVRQDGGAEAAPFNFNRAGMIGGDGLRTLRTLDEQFARNLTHTLGASLRTNITVTAQPADQQTFGAFVQSVLPSAHVVPLRIETLPTRCAMAFDLKLAPAIIDLLLGGSGRTAELQRDLTEIEEAVLGSVLELVLREWNTAWASFDLRFDADTRERENQSQRLMPVQERVLLCRFQMTMADVAGDLVFCLPSPAVVSALRSLTHRRGAHRRRTEEERTRRVERLLGSKVQIALQFPSMRLRASALRELQPGSLLPLPLTTGVSAECRIAGVSTHEAKPVRLGEHRAAQIMLSLEEPKNWEG